MNNKLFACLACLGFLSLLVFCAHSQIQFLDTSTLHTNSYSTSAQITISPLCTNAPYTTTNYVAITAGDSAATAYGKLNSDLNYITNRLAFVTITNSVPLPAFSTPYVTNLGSTMVAVLQFGLPAVPTNVELNSDLLIAYETNNVVWATSNYIGTVPGFYSIYFYGGYAGAYGETLPTNINQNVFASTNSGSSWFVVSANSDSYTNFPFNFSFQTTNPVEISVSGAGGGLGSLQINYVDYPTAMSRTNGHFGQVDLFDDPTQPQQPATKNYVDNSIANALNGEMSTTTTNGVNYTTFTQSGVKIWQTATYQQNVPVSYSRSGTNILINAAQTNLVAGWQMTSTTNLAVAYSFATYTNYLIATNSGIVTFTIPIIPGVGQRYYQLVGSSSSSSTFFVPVGLPYVSLASTTITHSTNSTYGYGPGLVTADSSYIYISVATNTWSRLAIPTNTW